MRPVVQILSQRKSSFDCGANLVAVALGEHRGKRHRLLQDHLRSCVAGRLVNKGESPLAIAAAFVEQRQSNEQRCCAGGQFYGQGSIAMIGERPIQGRSHGAYV